MSPVSLIMRGIGGLGRGPAEKKNTGRKRREEKMRVKKKGGGISQMFATARGGNAPIGAAMADSLRKGACLPRLVLIMDRGDCRSFWTASAETLDSNSCVERGGRPSKATSGKVTSVKGDAGRPQGGEQEISVRPGQFTG